MLQFNPFVEQRRRMKLDLLEMMQRNPEMEESQIVALFSLKTGLKRDTIRLMLEELQEAGLFKENVKTAKTDGDKRDCKRDEPASK